MPAQEVHLLTGDSNAGKTRWLIGALLEWEQGLPILGCKSNPVPWAYASPDRTGRSFERTLNGMGLSLTQVPFIEAFGAHSKRMEQIVQVAAEHKVELLVIEGFQKFVEPPGQGRQVQEFLEYLSKKTERSREFPNGLTFLGVAESPKMKPKERYEDPRQRVSGAAAWAYYSETVFVMERKNPKDNRDPERILHVSPKQGVNLALEGGFDVQGRLRFP